METFKSKFIIIYANGNVWQSNNESEAIARLDSDEYIITSMRRNEQSMYTTVFTYNNPMKEATSIYDED